MKRIIATILSAVLLLGCFAGVLGTASAAETTFTNLYDSNAVTQGYTSHELKLNTPDFVSSNVIPAAAGSTVWFGPCSKAQYFHLVGMAGGSAVTGKVRGKDFEVADTFSNGKVLYKYIVPAGVDSLVFAVPSAMASVFTVSTSEITSLTWQAYWKNAGVDPTPFVGENTYYEIKPGSRIYVGGVTEANMTASQIYSKTGSPYGNIKAEDLTLVESFGGKYGIYCYTVPNDNNIGYVKTAYDEYRADYYFHKIVEPGVTVSDDAIISEYIASINIPLPLASTVSALSGKSALFLGDSITYGARDRGKIFMASHSVNAEASGWAGRIGYFTGMDVTNNGVSGACITTARTESHSAAHYIYNNLTATSGTTYDYVIMHGMFNDASIPVEVGTPQGKATFKAENADVTKFASALELLFYTARKQNPDAILGYIVNFHTDRAVDQTPYAEMAIKICNDWGIPYLDLYNLAGFSVEFDDGLHPTSKGYDSMYTIVANWMAGLGSQAVTASGSFMSYNVYFGADAPESTGISIENRYLKAAQLIAREAPDIAVLQEVTDAFYQKAAGALSAYEYYGTSHGEGNEIAPIIWKKAKYTLVDKGSFEAPGEWCATAREYPRTINWVVLEDGETSKQLLVLSVHGQPDMDGVFNTEARNKTMTLVAERIRSLRGEFGNIPVVVGGDFNMAADSEAYSNLVSGGVRDIRATVNPGAGGSYNAWTRTEKFALGDYLFMGEGVNAVSFQVVSDDVDARSDGKFIHISDHSPIVAQIMY